MKKTKRKIYRSYKDFYTDEDLIDCDRVKTNNLSIDDFDAKGRICNPRAPCVVTSVDPDYVKDARQRGVVKKFRMKTDILTLREITRKKFMIYATQQRHLEMQREAERNERDYNRIRDFFKFAEASLREIESQDFSELMKANQMLRELLEVQLTDELKKKQDEHQKVLMSVHEAYTRFVYLLKLLSYFDSIEGCPTMEISNGKEDENTNLRTLPKPYEITELLTNYDLITDRLVAVKKYIEKVVKPYLGQKRHLNAELWFDAHERKRQKIFNYSRHLTRVALLNHVLSIISKKFEKTYAHRIEKQESLHDPLKLDRRVETLTLRAVKILSIYEEKHRKDKLWLKLRGIVPVILEQVERVAEQRNYELSKLNFIASNDCYGDSDTLEKVEKIHMITMHLLKEVDAIPVRKYKKIEQQVRKRLSIEKEQSKRALVKQTRMKNWIEHFKRHEMQKKK